MADPEPTIERRPLGTQGLMVSPQGVRVYLYLILPGFISFVLAARMHGNDRFVHLLVTPLVY
jgi:hypothetical protein